jgi:putative RecB family exonuclease
MTVYSHSRLSTFEQCPQKFKLRYIDKVETEVEESVEAFMGIRVHETLEKLYSDLRYQKKNTLEDLLGFLNDEWEKNWNDSIIIVKKEYGPESYQKMARKFVTDYYNRYDPFDQTKTIAIEERILINLDDSGDYKLQGYIDRLTEEKDGYYEIHDYKTNSRLPLPEYIDNDRQLALYSIGVKNRYPDAKDVRLIWHFLAFDKEIDSTRTDEELVELKQNTVQLIDTIEGEEEFPTNPSRLCDWCEYKEICRQWSHLYKLKDKPVNEYLNDSGVKLVNRYAELKAKQKQVKLDLYAEMEKVEEALIKFAEKEQVDVVFGSNNKVKITVSKRFASPSKHSKEREELEQLLKEHGKWDEVAQLDTSAINKIIMEKKWDDQILDVLKEYVKLEESKRLYLSKIKGE